MPLSLASDIITFSDNTTLTPGTVKWNYLQTTPVSDLIVYNKYITNTSGGTFSVTLPASPADGNYIVIADGFGSWETNNLTVNRNGKSINGLAENLICDVNYGKVELIYQVSANSWRTTVY